MVGSVTIAGVDAHHFGRAEVAIDSAKRAVDERPAGATKLTGADVVVVCFQVGGVDAYALDIEIPRRYGVDQSVGDTLGPGGIFRGLRSMHALEPITRDMHEVCPAALLLQYANPMSMNCWYTSGEGVHTVGLCHSVQHTADLLASVMGAAPGERSFKAAGINHQSWLLEYRLDGRDATDELRTAVREHARGERDAAERWRTGTAAAASRCARRSWI